MAENGKLCGQFAGKDLPDIDAGEIDGGFIDGKFDGFDGYGGVLHQIDLLEFFATGAQIKFDHTLGNGKGLCNVRHRHFIVVMHDEDLAVQTRQAGKRPTDFLILLAFLRQLLRGEGIGREHAAKLVCFDGKRLFSRIVRFAGVVRHRPEIRIGIVADAVFGDSIDTAERHFLTKLLGGIQISHTAARKAEKRGKILLTEEIVQRLLGGGHVGMLLCFGRLTI